MADAFKFADLITAADDAGFFVYPADTYDVVVDSADSGNTSNGKSVIKVKFRIVTGPYAGKGAKIFNNFVLSPENANALGFFFRHMEAMGLPREYFLQNPKLTQVAQALVGRPCRITVKDDREYNGQKQNDVVNVMPPSQPAGQPQNYQNYQPQQAGVPNLGAPPAAAPPAPAPSAPPVPAVPSSAPAVPPAAAPAPPAVEQPAAQVPPPSPPTPPSAPSSPPPQPVWDGQQWVMPAPPSAPPAAMPAAPSAPPGMGSWQPPTAPPSPNGGQPDWYSQQNQQVQGQPPAPPQPTFQPPAPPAPPAPPVQEEQPYQPPAPQQGGAVPPPPVPPAF